VPPISLVYSSFGTNSLVTMADSALYDVLGVSSRATDTELKKVKLLQKTGQNILTSIGSTASLISLSQRLLSFNYKHVLPSTAFLWPPSHSEFYLCDSLLYSHVFLDFSLILMKYI